MTAERRPRERGFSLLELLVALAVVSVALVIAARLMVEAQRRALTEQTRIVDAVVPIALRQLQADSMAAASGLGDPRRKEPMTLIWPSGVRIGYDLAGSKLRRTRSDSPGERVVLTGVTGFTWTWLAGEKPAVRIVLEYERTMLPGPEVRSGQRVFVRRGRESQSLLVTMRGAGGVGW